MNVCTLKRMCSSETALIKEWVQSLSIPGIDLMRVSLSVSLVLYPPQSVVQQQSTNQRKNSHRRTPSLIGPLDKLKAGMAKIVPAAFTSDAPAAIAESNSTVMELIGATAGGGEDDQQLDIPIFKTEEGQYLATGTEY